MSMYAAKVQLSFDKDRPNIRSRFFDAFGGMLVVENEKPTEDGAEVDVGVYFPSAVQSLKSYCKGWSIPFTVLSQNYD